MDLPEETAKWIKEFKAQYDLDRPMAKQPDLAEDRSAAAVAYAVKNIPVLFAQELPTLPAVKQWVADIIRTAVDDSQSKGRAVAQVHTGPSLLFLGRTGVGKTSQIFGALRALNLCGLYTPWIRIPAADLYARLRPRDGVDSEVEYRAFADAPILAVDDLAAAKTSPWVEEINYRLINYRYENVLPTLLTTNVTPKELREWVGDRVASRLVQMTRRVPMTGPDWRREQ